jgi:hypothetical protein
MRPLIGDELALRTGCTSVLAQKFGHGFPQHRIAGVGCTARCFRIAGFFAHYGASFPMTAGASAMRSY